MSGIRPEGFHPESINCQENLVITATHGFGEIEREARNITLLNGSIPGFHPYRSSLITLEEVPLNQIHPCTLYVLEPQLGIIKQLRNAFLKQGVDLLRMTSDKALIEYRWGNHNHCIISPPVVEVSEDDGDILVLVDGLHRVLSQELRLPTINVILVKKTACPLPVKPVSPNEIRRCEVVPPTKMKRHFRFEKPEEISRWLTEHFERFKQGFPPEQQASPPEQQALSPDYYFFRDLRILSSLGEKRKG